MIFQNVKSITIPEGNVASIKDAQGVILWEANSAPNMVLAVSRGESEKFKIDISISNLKYENVQQVIVLYRKAAGVTDIRYNTAGVTHYKFGLTESGWPGSSWSRTIYIKPPLGTSVRYMIRGYLKYTDSNGETQTLYTDTIKTTFDALP